MPRKWEGKWFKSNAGAKKSRKNGRGRPKRGGTLPVGNFPQVQVVFQMAASMPKPPASRVASARIDQARPSARPAAATPKADGAEPSPTTKVTDPTPTVGKRARRHSRRHGCR